MKITEHGVSAANREGAEGEPQATLGGRKVPPHHKAFLWCRFCGSLANTEGQFRDNMMCDTCVSTSMETSFSAKQLAEMFKNTLAEATKAFETFGDTLKTSLLPAPELPQSQYPTIPQEVPPL